MAEGKGRKTAAKTIDDLLGERSQFELWLGRLDENTELASEQVRERIRGDYQTRLEAVVQELSTHGDAIAEQLAEHRNSQADLTVKEAAVEDELAEAEVRHAVGEYEDDAWETLKSRSEEELGTIRTELTEVSGEINRLVEVQALIAAPATVAEAVAGDDAGSDTAEAGGEDVIAISSDEATDEAQTVGAPKFTPRGADAGNQPTTPRTLRFPTDTPGTEGLDELDFLKSVTEDDATGPSASRASGQFEAAEAGAEEHASAAAKTTATDEAGAEPGSDASPTQAKTLKCGECGELNRPTEWYCERCGAELASL